MENTISNNNTLFNLNSNSRGTLTHRHSISNIYPNSLSFYLPGTNRNFRNVNDSIRLYRERRNLHNFDSIDNEEDDITVTNLERFGIYENAEIDDFDTENDDLEGDFIGETQSSNNFRLFLNNINNMNNQNTTSCNDTLANNNQGNNNGNNNETEPESSTVNSNDIVLDSSFEKFNSLNRTNRNNNQNNNQNMANNNINSITNHKNQQNPSQNNMKNSKTTSTIIRHERIFSAPLQLLNALQEFKYSSQYINLEKAFLYANGLILLRAEGRFDIESEEGGEICHKFLRQLELLMRSLGIKGENRDYRKKFSKAYYYLFDEDSLCYLTEILDSAQETSPYLIVNSERFSFSREVLENGTQLFQSFCSLIMLLTDSVKNIRDELFYNDIKKLKNEIKSALIEFDKKWVKYEEIYIKELIEIEKKSRRLIFEGIEIDKQLTKYELKSKIKGKILINDKEYNNLRNNLVNVILNLNKVANVEGKGRDDLPIDILLKAENVLITVSENLSKGIRNLAVGVKKSLLSMRNLFNKYSKNIEGVDPQLRNNKDLSNALLDFETKWERGKIYLLDEVKYKQLIFFSQIIEIICEKYNNFSIRELIGNEDPSIFVSLPCILLLKAMDKEDHGICKEYISGLYDKNNESGLLFYDISQIQKSLKKKLKNSNKVYNLLEKLILSDGTKEQEIAEKDLVEYIEKDKINLFKKGLNNLSMHLQRNKPTDWNNFFELAMDIKNTNDLGDKTVFNNTNNGNLINVEDIESFDNSSYEYAV